MPIQKSHGTKFFIGTKTSPLASETTWTRITDVHASGANFGSTYGSTDATTFSDAWKQDFKTIADAGDLELSIRLNLADAGQAALKLAAEDKANTPYNFKIEMDDDAVSVGDSPTKFSFQVRVMSFLYGPGSMNGLYEAKSKLSLVSGVTYVAAAA